MKIRARCLVMAVAVLSTGVAFAQDSELPLKNWTAPPYWTPPRAAGQAAPDDQMQASAEGMTASTQSLPSAPVPFVAIAPCRIVDTRASQGFAAPFGAPSLAASTPRSFPIPSSTACTGIPGDAAAYSFNVTVVAPPNPYPGQYITLYPTGASLPTVSTLNFNGGQIVANAAVIPAGTSGSIDVWCTDSVNLIIDINGYYAPENVVNTVNTLTGDVTLSPGSNIAITPSTNTLTIAMTGVPGGTLPAGTYGQTLYSNGSGWLASSALTNDGTNVGVANNLLLPNTGSGGASGVIELGGNRFLHDYGPAGSYNSFVGDLAGNFTLTGVANATSGDFDLSSDTTGTGNTASGYKSLYSNTTGNLNAATGDGSLYANTTGAQNTATGAASLYSNTSGLENTATGAGSLNGSTTGNDNTASGFSSANLNSTGFRNTATGAYSLSSNTTGSYNVALGFAAGYLLTAGDYNVDIGNQGVAAEGNTIRIGDSNQTRAFVAGIRGVTTANPDAIPVVIDSAGQLGTVSSSIRFKQDVADMGDASSRLLELRPVTFHYKTQPDGPLQYGLIAEEVEQVMPELVVRDATGRVETVAYQELPAMLLNELQKEQKQIAAEARTDRAQRVEIAAQQARLDAEQSQIDGLRRQVQVLVEARGVSGNGGAARP